MRCSFVLTPIRSTSALMMYSASRLSSPFTLTVFMHRLSNHTLDVLCWWYSLVVHRKLCSNICILSLCALITGILVHRPSCDILTTSRLYIGQNQQNQPTFTVLFNTAAPLSFSFTILYYHSAVELHVWAVDNWLVADDWWQRETFPQFRTLAACGECF